MNPTMSSWEIKLQIKFNTSECKAMPMGKNKATHMCARMDSKLTHITEGSAAESPTKTSAMVHKAN